LIRAIALTSLILILIVIAGFFVGKKVIPNSSDLQELTTNDEGGEVENKITFQLQIEEERKTEYTSSDITTEQTLEPGSNYNRYIASYKSDGLTIYGLLTIPDGDIPSNGWPVVIFNHGYIPPEEYRTTERYVAYQDGFARNGYITFKSDYRGHGNSEGQPSGAYYSDGYIRDVLNLVESIKKYQAANPAKIGMWGHSLGGHLTLRAMVVSPDIKAGVIWGGVVAHYSDMINNWHRGTPFTPSEKERVARRNSSRQKLIEMFGTPEQAADFWNSISPISYVKDISGPVQIHHGSADETVPYEFSVSLDKALTDAGKTHEFYLYEGADHNLSGPFNLAMERSIDFFDKYLKDN